jgi:lysine 2,3-aminomutase
MSGFRPDLGGFAKSITDRFTAVGKGPFSHVSDEDWYDWKWQMRNRITDINELGKYINLSPDEILGAEAGLDVFKIGITPYFVALMDKDDPNCPVRLQATPRPQEMIEHSSDMDDPLAEERDMPVMGLTHRYPDRVLMYMTQECAMFCRHCTRKRKVADPHTAADDDQIQAGIDYIARTPVVRDVIISGGDALAVSDERLEAIVSAIRAIPHVEIIRIGTRMPVSLPMRITDELLAMLKKYHPIYLNTHFNHPRECTAESFTACARIADAGIPIGNQTVLLKGINDKAETIMKLNHTLLMMRVRPYYIFQCDPTYGNYHFRTSVSKGIEIIKALRGWTSGLAVPYYVIDCPGGGGKVPIIPDYVKSWEGRELVVRNFRGDEYTYVEPREDNVEPRKE